MDQRRAVLHHSGPLWITAGPGSGKSEVLVARALRLVLCDSVDPASIILTTFTVKAAKNLADRMAMHLDRLGYADKIDLSGMRIGTLHSLCNNIMREHRFPAFDQLELLDDPSRAFFLYERSGILAPLKRDWTDLRWLFSRVGDTGPSNWPLVEAGSFIFDRITEYQVDVPKMSSSGVPGGRALAEAYQDYRRSLEANSRCDLAILQEHFLRFLDSRQGKEFLEGSSRTWRAPIHHILVDEYQDTNPIQESIYFRLAERPPHNLVIVGDDDQALYRFRGGTVDALVEFGDRAKKRWAVAPARIDLNHNFRSHPKIVEWFNHYVTSIPLMSKPGVRAPQKRPMVARSGVTGAYPAVSAVLAPHLKEAAASLADLIVALRRQGTIRGWEDVAILLYSTRQTRGKAGPYVDALRERKVPVHNPRNRAMQKDALIQGLLGALVIVLDDDLAHLRSGEIRSQTVVTSAEQWVKAYQILVSTKGGAALGEYVEKSHKRIRGLRKNLPLRQNLLDILYRILAYEPFRTAKKDADIASRLATITSLLNSFISSSDRHLLIPIDVKRRRAAISPRFLGMFYYRFAAYVLRQGLNEQEDELDLIPKGFVQVMTVHQAKGLEFPVVVVGSLDSEPEIGRTHVAEDFLARWCERRPKRSPLERAEQDLVRRFYVAISRPKNALIYCGVADRVSRWGVGD